MRYILIALSALMLLFAAVQYNDPDGPLWMVIYAIPAAFACIAAFQPQWCRTGIVRAVLIASIFASIAAVIYYWPTTPNFWLKDVWWNTETAREGMGVMIGLIVLLVVFAASTRPASRL